jgi:hypothetical protein
MDDWPLWKRVSFVNVATLIGISMGFASAQAPLSPSYCVPVAVLAGALMNVMFLVARPKIIKARREGLDPPTVWVALWSVVRERPVIILIVVLQMIGTSRSLTTAVIFIQSSRSSYVRSLPSASMIATRMIATSFLISGAIFANTVLVADLNNDGNPDLAVLHECASAEHCDFLDGAVAILLGNGDGTFHTPQVFDSGGSFSLGMTVADLNGDSKPDLVIANGAQAGNTNQSVNGSAAVLLGNGDGTFICPTRTTPLGWTPRAVAVANLRAHGQPDIVVANQRRRRSHLLSSKFTLLSRKEMYQSRRPDSQLLH